MPRLAANPRPGFELDKSCQDGRGRPRMEITTRNHHFLRMSRANHAVNEYQLGLDWQKCCTGPKLWCFSMRLIASQLHTHIPPARGDRPDALPAPSGIARAIAARAGLTDSLAATTALPHVPQTLKQAGGFRSSRRKRAACSGIEGRDGLRICAKCVPCTPGRAHPLCWFIHTVVSACDQPIPAMPQSILCSR